MKEIDWRKAPAWAQAFAKVIYVHPTLAEDYAWISADGYNVAPFGHCKNICHPYKEDTFTLGMFRVVEFRPLAKPAITITKKMAILEAALRSCVAIMDRDLSSMALIQPELKEAKQALKDIYLADSESTPWSGEGCPPVGEDCEALWSELRGEWLKTKVFGVNEHGQPIHRWEEGPNKFEYQASPLTSPVNGQSYFRPIRTPPERIAAEERSIAISEIVRAIGWHHGAPGADEAAARVYDAGYRKQVQP